MRELPRGTVTLLFTDIEGSTRLLQRLGRDRYIASLEAHRRLLRETFAARGGIEVEMQGDSFFFAFPYARDAVTAAAEGLRALADHSWDGDPIRVRFGLHTGEPTISGGLYAGLDVHRAARVMSAAHGGQVLLSERTADFVSGELPPDLTLRRLGRYHLKDFDHPEGLAQLMVDGLTATLPPLRAERAPTGPKRFVPRTVRRHPWWAAAAATVVTTAVVVPLALLGTAPISLDANAIATLDAESGRVTGIVPVGDTPSSVLAAGGSLWVANAGEATVSRVDPKLGRVVRTIPMPGTPVGLTAGAGSVWTINSDLAATQSSVSRIDPRYARVVATTALPATIAIGSGAGITSDGRSIWAVTQAGRAFRIDPHTNKLRGTVPVGDDPTSLAASAGSVWVANKRSASISRIQPPDTVTGTVGVGALPTAIAAGAGSVWVADAGEDAVRRIDPHTATVLATIEVGDTPTAIAASRHAVWVGNEGDRTVMRIDPRTNHVTKTVHVDFPPSAIAISGGTVYVALQAEPAPPPSGRGGTVHVLSVEPGAVDSVDPPLAYTVESWQIEYATCAKLVNYPDAAGAEGFRLRPEIARALPQVSNGGRTFSFRIRDGYRFSPPSNEAVTARTFKYTIERALDPKTKSFAPYFFSDIVGVGAFRAGRAPHISGVTANGDVLTIRLAKPAGDLTARLAMPFFCLVPIGTPVDFKGLAGVPSAGPYYVASYAPGKDLLLRRNPNYHGSRPHRLAAIDIRTATESAALAAVKANRSDFVMDAHAIKPSPRYASRFARLSRPVVLYLALNTSRPLFRDATTRRAVALALDRAALVRFDPSLRPVESILPTGFPGASPRLAYRSPNVARARRLVPGLHAKAVYMTCNRTECAQKAAVVARQLRPLGIDVVVKQLEANVLFAKTTAKGAAFDLTDSGFATDYVDPADFLVPLATAGGIKAAQSSNLAYFTNPEVEAAIKHALGLTGRARMAAFAAIEWRLRTRDVPYVAVATDTLAVLFSARTGCRVNNPAYGLDLAALCIRSR